MEYRVAISTATKGSIEAVTAAWREQAMVRLAPNVELHWEVSGVTLEAARCRQVDAFLASKCTHLFLLDSDTIPPPNAIEKLLAFDFPFIAAPHTSAIGRETGIMVLDRNPKGKDYIQHHPWREGSGLQGPNVVVGCAGMLIRRDVFEKVGRPWFRCIHHPITGQLVKTEDFDFCDRMHACGMEVWADCNTIVHHKLGLVV